MKINLIFLAISVFVLVKIPSGMGLLVDAFLYASLVWWQFCYSKVALQNLVLLGVISSLAILVFGFQIYDVVPLTGVAVYTTFFFIYLFHAINGTAPVEPHLRGARKVRRSGLFLSALISALAVVLSFALQPSSSYIYIPILVFTIGILMRSRLWFFPENSRFEYQKGMLKVVEVRSDSEILEYREVLLQAYREIHLEIKQTSTISELKNINLEKFNELVCSELKEVPLPQIYLVKKDDRAVGCFKLTLDKQRVTDAWKLPIEKDLAISLDSVRARYGAIGEVGRFAILENQRNSPLIIDTIFRAIAHVCMKEDVLLLYCQGMAESSPLYRKIGFDLMFPGATRVVDQEFGVPILPLVLNVPRILSQKLEARKKLAPDSATKKKFSDYLKRNRCENLILLEDREFGP